MNAIEIRGLEKRFRDFSLCGIDLSLPEGCILGLVGENGAGKTTFIKTMLDLYHRDTGSVKILGRSVPEDLTEIRRGISVLLDDVGLPAQFTAADTDSVMRDTFGDWDSASFFSVLERFGVPADKSFSELSQGMKKKTGIAVALSHGARLLVLDEPTSGLDPVARDIFLDMLADYTRREDCAVIFSSHIVTDLEKICDYICFLREGRVWLFEEKDRLTEEYGVISVSLEDAEKIPQEKIAGIRKNSYGAQLIMHKSQIGPGKEVSPVTLEDLFVMMARR